MKFNSFYWMFTFVKQFLLMKERRCICSCNLQLKAEITLNFDSPVFSWQMQMVFKEFFRVIPYRWMSPIYTYLVNQAYESATFWIRSPEWKFLNTLCIRNRVDAKSGFIIHSKLFPWFWLAKSTRIIHHNHLLMTKFGRILRWMNVQLSCKLMHR